MSTNKLHLFSKDTDATATERGYHYQKLKTLKTWLENRIAGVDEAIYCDYDDDIVQRNFAAGTTKFRQIKLYSSNFSFSTEEIAKSLANFFMLFTKGDYLFDEATFVFETNASVARQVAGNDADLLREWAAKQDAMDDELLGRCVARVQSLMDVYIQEGYDKEKQKDISGEFLQAKSFYEQLPANFWEHFVRSIRWQFDGVSSDEAIPQLLEEITTLLQALPLPIDHKQVSTYIAVLHFEIAQRTISKEPEERVLNNQLLDVLVLNEGSERDKWYADVYQKWSAVAAVTDFSVGTFLEAIDATRHCRWNLHGADHTALWLSVLKGYIGLADIPMVFKRKAIYEYLFLKMSTDMAALRPTGSIADEGELIREYFDHFEERFSLATIEEDLSLLQVVTAQSLRSPDFIDPSDISRWSDLVSTTIDEKLAAPRDVNERCQLLELKGIALMQLKLGMNNPQRVKEAVLVFREIIPLLATAKFYTISRLSDLLGQMITLYIRIGGDREGSIQELETFLHDISDAAVETDKRHSEAHRFVERGVAYLEQGGAKNFLRALDNFHKAAGLWLMQETTEGYILSLLNTAQVYNALGANIAGKYFGLCAIWSTLHVGEQQSLKRISDGYAMVFHSDYQQGAWLSALGDYLPFMNFRRDLIPERVAADEMVIKTFADLLLILESAERVFPELVHFINFYKVQLGDFYAAEMQYLVEPMKNTLAGEADLDAFIHLRIDDVPFNDAGPERTIRFKMLGVEWRISFESTYLLTGMAEEFCSLLQIVLCEIGLSGRDARLTPGVVQITVTQGEGNLVELVKGNQLSWSVKMPYLNAHEPDKIRLRYGSMSAKINRIVAERSALSPQEMEGLFTQLYEKQKLGDKGMSATSYQRAYYEAFDVAVFERSQRGHFPSIANRFGMTLRDPFA